MQWTDFGVIKNETSRFTALMSHNETMQQDVHQSHLKLVLKRIKREKITRKAEAKGRKEKKKKRKEMEKEKRSSAEELSLSHSLNKIFCKVQKPNCILSVSLKR